ncbi:MAG: tyrosine-type recombinase/integrase [Patescibacteria group bacterium]
MQKTNKSLISFITSFLEYLEVEKGLAVLSVVNYARFINKFKNWLNKNYPDLKPHNLTADIIYQFRLYLSRQGVNATTKQNLKKSTQNYYLIALRNFLAYLIEKDIDTLPPGKIKLAKDNMRERVVKFLNLEQLERLLLSPKTEEISGLRDKAIMETLFSTGLRVAELVNLNRDQFNLKIIKNANYDSLELSIVGKGSHPRPIYFSRRSLDWIIRYLEARKDMERPLFINHQNFKNDKSEHRLTTRSIENILTKYSKIAGLPFIATPHTLRHTYATDLLNKGADLRIVQEFLGHKNIMTTQIYTHVTNKRLKDLHQKFHSGKNLKNE